MKRPYKFLLRDAVVTVLISTLLLDQVPQNLGRTKQRCTAYCLRRIGAVRSLHVKKTSYQTSKVSQLATTNNPLGFIFPGLVACYPLSIFVILHPSWATTLLLSSSTFVFRHTQETRFAKSTWICSCSMVATVCTASTKIPTSMFITISEPTSMKTMTNLKQTLNVDTCALTRTSSCQAPNIFSPLFEAACFGLAIVLV